jgi:homocysteine S-methyltransferase
MAKAGERATEEGVKIAKEFLREACAMVDGVYIMPPFNRFEMAYELLEVL